MEVRFPPPPAGDSSPHAYDTNSSSSFDHEAVRKGRGGRPKNQIRERICESAEDSLGSSLLERHISKLSDHQSTACECVVDQVRGSAAWSSFIEKSTTDSSQATPDDLRKTSNILSDSLGAYDKLRARKSIEGHLQENFIETRSSLRFFAPHQVRSQKIKLRSLYDIFRRYPHGHATC